MLEVDVGVAQGPSGDHVPADPDGENGSGSRELLEEHRLGHIGGKVAHVERGHRVVGGPWLSLGGRLGKGASRLGNCDDGALHLERISRRFLQNDFFVTFN